MIAAAAAINVVSLGMLPDGARLQNGDTDSRNAVRDALALRITSLKKLIAQHNDTRDALAILPENPTRRELVATNLETCARLTGSLEAAVKQLRELEEGR